MTTITARFDGETYTRETDHPYTFASKRDGVVRFHESSSAAKRAAGAYGRIVRTDYVRRHKPKATASVWAVYDADGVEVGRYEVEHPPDAIRKAREDGHAPAKASKVS